MSVIGPGTARPPRAEPADPERHPALRVEALSRSFGALEALSGLDLEIPPGQIVGVIGPNGSGKTTLLNVVAGIHPASRGRVWIGSREVTALPPHAIARLGVARTFQNLRLFGRMTVLENVRAAQHRAPGVRAWELIAPGGRAERARRRRAEHLLDATGLAPRRDHLAAELPLGEQRRLELARALAREPRVLLLDEPAGGMTPVETEAMGRLIRDLAAPGRTVVLVEHKVRMVMSLCHRVVVLNFGRKIAEGPPDAVQADPRVAEAYLGPDDPDA